jgi:hypothetical protein
MTQPIIIARGFTAAYGKSATQDVNILYLPDTGKLYAKETKRLLRVVGGLYDTDVPGFIPVNALGHGSQFVQSWGQHHRAFDLEQHAERQRIAESLRRAQ